MAKQKNQTSRDISELAARFRAAWNDGQVLKSWLRVHGHEILELAKSGQWSWENLGRAMTEAGITYQTGTPWTGENLRRNLLRAQLPGKRELKLLRGGRDTTAPAVIGDMSGPTNQAPRQSGVPQEESGTAVLPSLSNGLPPHEISVSAFRDAGNAPRKAAPEFELIRRAIESGHAGAEVSNLPSRRPRRNLSPEELHDIALGRSAKR